MVDLTEISELHNINANYLAIEYGYSAIEVNQFTLINSAPNVICYGKGEFTGKFLFDETDLKRIILIPKIPGIKAPDYPDEDYQNIKKEYCASVLRDIYGDETASNDVGVYWERENIIIGCHLILGGQNQHTGGDIFIHLN